jgi:predicted dehydrogenase
MAANGTIRVGIVGASAKKGFASIAHIPALKGLPGFEIAAVCASSPATAEAAAKHYGVKLAFHDAAEMARHPGIDLVTVCVKAPEHFKPVMAAIEAGKHVYCEWPLGRTTVEAEQMLAAADKKAVRHAVGLQGRLSPAINYVKDLVAEGYLGKPLSATMIGCAPNWGATLEGGYQADRNNGANLMTVTGGHTLDALCQILGEFRELSALAVSQRDTIPEAGTGRILPKTSPDQLAVAGVLSSGAVASFQVRGGVNRGTAFLLEIHGDNGDIVVAATSRASMQRQELTVQGARGDKAPLAPLPVPEKYRFVPAAMSRESPYNVAQVYVKLAEAIAKGKPAYPGFDIAVTRHRLLDAIVRSSETGQKQVV